MDALQVLEDEIWRALPLHNLKLRAKIRQLAHKNTIEVLTLCLLPVEPDSLEYRTTYTNLF
jgi:hypothetical protein